MARMGSQVPRQNSSHPNQIRSHHRNRRYATALLLFSVLSFPAARASAQQIPAGTLLPIALATRIDSAKAKAGNKVSGKLAQEVALPAGTRLRRGTPVLGHITEVTQASAGSPARIVLTFDRVNSPHGGIPVTASLRALASMNEVFEAELPTNDVADYGSSVADWNTRQVGGQGVYRRMGILVSGPDTVGRVSWSGGVFAVPRSAPNSRCIADPTTASEQSLWVFSSDACGTYGLDGLTLQHAGRSEPVGQIVLTSSRKIEIRSGSGWLLTVLAGPPATSPAAGE